MTGPTGFARHLADTAAPQLALSGVAEFVVQLLLVFGTVAVCTALIAVFARMGVLFKVVGALTALVGVSAVLTGLLYGELDLGQRILFAGLLGPVLLFFGIGAFRANGRAQHSSAQHARGPRDGSRLP